MDPIELKLTPAIAPLRGAVAWRLPGADPQRWLELVARWDVPHGLVELAPLPTSARDRTPVAALVRCRDAGRPKTAPPERAAIAYGVVASRLYLPVDAQLWPAIEEAELEKLIATRTYVWQPQSGLIAMEKDPWLPLSKFIGRPSWTLGDWEAPREGLILAPRVVSLRAEIPPDVDEMLEEGQDDIGSKADAAEEMPKSPDESQSGAMNAAKDQAQKMAAGAAGAVSKILPGSWAERLGAWAEKQQASADRRMEADRNKELERLLNLMEKDPDEGLKFAPPLSNDVAHRGEADPSGRLEERDPNFDFARLSSGGPAEAWNVSGAHYYKLRMQYREAANRELQLKRFRRAAYIFSELLGDHQAAASALASGKFYREAATLYQKKLNLPRRAAECLEQGGLLTDAIEIYLDLEMFEKVGDLYRQLNQTEEARRHYQLAVEALREQEANRDHLAIAELLHTKLDERDEAMTELAAAWPHSSQPVACLCRWFDLALKDVEPAVIQSQIVRLADATAHQAFASAEILFHAAATHSGNMAEAASDALQTLISKQLLAVQPTRRNQLVSYLQRLHPADRLLVRDCRNFLQRREKRSATPGVHGSSPVAGCNTLVARTKLLEGVSWSRICLLDDVVFAAGTKNGRIAIAAAPWGGSAADAELPWQNNVRVPAEGDLLLAANTHKDATLLVHLVFRFHGYPLPLRPLRGIKRRHSLQAGGSGGVSSETLAACRAAHGLTWSASYTGNQLVLSCYQSDQMISSRVLIDDSELEPPEYLPRIAASGHEVFVSWGPQLFIAASNVQEVLHDMPQEIRRLACSAPHSRSRVAMGYDVGGSIVWNQQTDFKILPFGDGLVHPEVCINRGGYLVAAAAKRIEVYSTRNATLKLVGENEDASLNPVDVIGGPGSHQFAVLNGNGELQFYETA